MRTLHHSPKAAIQAALSSESPTRRESLGFIKDIVYVRIPSQREVFVAMFAVLAFEPKRPAIRVGD
jgi:hypothetical protein